MLSSDAPAQIRVLITGAGGPAAIAVMHALRDDPSISMVVADMDPWASGLYLDPDDEAVLIPAGADPTFTDVLLSRCLALGINLVIPTVDAEMLPLSQAAAACRFHGIQLLLPSTSSLKRALDKLALAEACEGIVRVPRTELLGETDPRTWEYPVIIKPRRGSGSRGIRQIDSADELALVTADEDVLVQELLPGEEYSVDVLADRHGRVVAAVPRIRARVDSGVAVAGRTLCDDELEGFARDVVTTLGLPFVSNVQIRRNRDGAPALLEVNPRVPGTLALSVASGVDMMRLAVDSLRGEELPDSIRHREVAMVRYLAEKVVEVSDLLAEPVATGTMEVPR